MESTSDKKDENQINCPKKHGLSLFMTPENNYECNICDEKQKLSSKM